MVKMGDLKRAERRALAMLDEWIETTGVVEGSSHRDELESVVEDAVHCGAQAASGVSEPLPSERSDGEQATRPMDSRALAAMLGDKVPYVVEAVVSADHGNLVVLRVNFQETLDTVHGVIPVEVSVEFSFDENGTFLNLSLNCWAD